ncbi:MAG TPA: DUF2085 domain-containing protein [Anaerolineaceae bacterium]|nr:DUF2085 domain-containing protein [Anaerolineaceae bacterium]
MSRPTLHTLWKPLLVGFGAAVLILWLAFAPPGLLGKADAVGYAVCHRITERSFMLGDRAMPVCARCSGTFLGALLGLAYQLPRGRRGKLPPVSICIALGVLALAWAFDGFNSYMHFFEGAPHFYEPQNWLRLATGTGLGLGMALVLLPIMHQTFFTTFDDRPAIPNWGAFGGLLGLAALLNLVILTENPLVLYPLAVLSSVSVLTLLTLCYSLLLVIFLKRDGLANTWRDVWPALVGGLTIALLQTLVIDAVRLYLTGSWGGLGI